MGWRVKFVFVLMVYFTGFATAIYWLAPSPETSEGGFFGKANGKTSKEGLTQAVNSGMHKAVDLGREAADRAGELIQQKILEYQSQGQSAKEL